jgi:hypothetical protein
VKVAFNASDSAEDVTLNQFRCGSETTVASPLRSDLDNPIGLPPNPQTLVRLIQIVCHRFLAISIFVRFHCINRMSRVLEVGCGNYDCVHFLACQQIFVGDELEWLTTITLFDEIRCSFQIPPPNIANGDNFRVQVFPKLVNLSHQIRSPRTSADDANLDSVISTFRPLCQDERTKPQSEGYFATSAQPLSPFHSPLPPP